MPWISKRKIAARADKHAKHSKRSNEWNRYYQNKTYKKLREWYMNNNPLCIDCLFEGRSTPATELHHITPISTGETDEDRFALLLDWEHNFAPLCSDCHHKRHKLLNMGK